MLSTPANGGPSAARNVGLRAAKGEWIALLDADDAWKPGRLERLLAVARATSADFVADNLVMWDVGANVEVKPFFYELPAPQKQITALDLFEADDNFDFSKKSFALIKPLYLRQFIVEHKIEYNETMKVGEDFTFYVESLLNGAKMILIEEAFYIYSMPHAPSGRSPHSRSVYRFGALSELTGMLERQISRSHRRHAPPRHEQVSRHHDDASCGRCRPRLSVERAIRQILRLSGREARTHPPTGFQSREAFQVSLPLLSARARRAAPR